MVTAILIGLFLLFIPVYFYLKSVIVYQPLSIRISGITEQEAGNIKIICL